MSFDLTAAQARAAAIWTPENLAELQRRRHGGPGEYGNRYPTGDDIAWLRSLGVYDVPRRSFDPDKARARAADALFDDVAVGATKKHRANLGKGVL